MGGMDTVWGGVSAEPVSSPFIGLNRFMARRSKHAGRVRQAQMKSIGSTPSARVVETPNDYVMGTGSGAGFGIGSFTYWKGCFFYDSYCFTEALTYGENGTLYGSFDGVLGLFNFSTQMVEPETGGTEGDMSDLFAIATSGTGDVYSAHGLVVSNLDFPGYLQKFDSHLVFVASVTVPPAISGNAVAPWGLAVDQDGTIFMGGFDSNSPGGLPSGWLRKFNSDMVLLASATVSPQGDVIKIGLGNDGFIYACGEKYVGLTDSNIWLGKFNKNLSLINETQIDSGEGFVDTANSLAFDKSGNVYVAGSIYEVTGGTNAWIGKFDSGLVLVASASIEGTLDGQGDTWDDIAVVGPYVYVTGRFGTPTYYPHGGTGTVLVMGQYTKDLVNVISITPGNLSGGHDDRGTSMAYDSHSSLFVGGRESDIGWLSRHTIIGENSALTTADKPLAYPNPFRLSQGQTTMTIGNLAPNQTLKLFTLKGELVRSISTNSGSEVTWDLKNESGESVQSGVYFGLVDGQSSDKSFKVVVQR